MSRHSRLAPCWVLACWLGLAPGQPLLAAVERHFEARQTHPLELSRDGGRLLAVNSFEGRLSLFQIVAAEAGSLRLIDEIPVGLEPVSVRARTENEVWVVNEVSDSISVVALDRGVVIATLPCPDEPSDVVFAGGRAFVSCARNGLLRVFETESRREVMAVPLVGHSPRALAVNQAGTEVYVGFLLSGNRSTILPASATPLPEAPTDPALPPAPATALIVDASDARVAFQVLDHDVAVVPVANPEQVAYLDGVGTSILSLEVRPGGGELWVGNTEADNRVRYEPRLRGRFASNRLTRIRLGTGEKSFLDLSPFDAQGQAVDPAGASAALAQPMAMAFTPEGESVWVAAFASDRVARLSVDDSQVRERIDLRAPGEDSRRMRGPRGLALDAATGRLYVLNKLANSVSILDTRGGGRVAEVPVSSQAGWPPTPRDGRGFLFDARLSGNGATSCGTCHIDADVDGLAWDLGDPAGTMATVEGANLAVHDPTVVARPVHPMKGPMLTQTLRGIEPGRRLHWRGDRPSLQHFNPTFRDLMGGNLIEERALDELQAYLSGLRHHPNPNRNPDDSLPTSFQGGNAVRGATLFAAHLHHCGVCHVLPRGTDHNVDDPRNLRLSQPIQNPSLHTTYQRAVLDTRPGATNISGFGLLHDGTGGLQALPTVHFYDLDALSGVAFKDVAAFVLCFDTGTAPAMGRSATLTYAARAAPEFGRELDLLEQQAAREGVCDLVLHGVLNGQRVQFLFDPALGRYVADRAAEPSRTRESLLAMLTEADALTALAVPSGSGMRRSLDRNANGTRDADEVAPRLLLRRTAEGVILVWATSPEGWTLESTPATHSVWLPDATARRAGDATWERSLLPADAPFRFFRLRRTW